MTFSLFYVCFYRKKLEAHILKNTNSDTTLLKVDVANGRIGVDLEAVANELQVSQTIQTTDLLSTTSNAGVANFTIIGNNIDAINNQAIYLDAGEHIQLSNLETEQFYITDNYISTNNILRYLLRIFLV